MSPLLALQLLTLPVPGAPICGAPAPWPASFAALYDSASDVAYTRPAVIAFPKSKADGKIQFNMQLLASHRHRTSTDSAHVELEFWMDTELEPKAMLRATYSVPDTIPMRVTLDDSTQMGWLVVAKRPWGVRVQSGQSSTSESMFVQAPPAQLARLVSASGATIELRARKLAVTRAQLAEWRTVARWAWCPAERPGQPRSPN